MQNLEVYLSAATFCICFFVGCVLLWWAWKLRHSPFFLKWWFLSMAPVKFALAGWALGRYFELGEELTFVFRSVILLAVGTQAAYAFAETRRAQRQVSSFILIIEDNETLARVYRRVLEAVGYTAEFATSGYDALTLITIHEMPMFIVTDIRLPDMTGVEAIRKIRELGFTGKAMAVSGSPVDANEDFVCTLTKPVTAAELVQAVRKHI